MKVLLKLLTFLALSTAAAQAIELPRLFSDHMVLQRNEPIAVFGRGEPGESVRVELANGEFIRLTTTTVDRFGEFKVFLEPLPAGRGYSLEVCAGEASARYEDLLIGDVWVCSGQSNMAWTLKDSTGAKEEIASSYNPDIRLFTVPHTNSESLVPEVTGGAWQVCGPSSSGDFSGVGYYFGKFLAAELDIPVGLIHTSWGGTMIESWTSKEALYTQENPERFGQKVLPETELHAEDPIESRINELFEEVNLGRAKDKQIHALKRTGDLPIMPTNLYNGMIHPLLDYPIKGAIWYQGESNATRAYEYRKLLPLMIGDWRKKWNLGDFPFYLVQLANFMEREDEPADSTWAELREAQCMTMDLPNTGMAVIIDIGEANDIHPKNKRDVGLRLALQALKKTYGREDLVASGPVLKRACLDNGSVRLSFCESGGGLVLKDSPRSGFELAEKDGDFHWADAEIVGDEIILRSDAVKEPHYVRYAWANNPYATLFNREGLPASPFRTDKRPGLTVDARYAPNIKSASSDSFSRGAARSTFFSKLTFTPAGDYQVAVSGSDENLPSNLFDGDLATRWSGLGLETMLLIDLGKETELESLQMATYNGHIRQAVFQLETSSNMEEWREVFFGITSGHTAGLEEISIEKSRARYLLFTFFGNTENFWNSVTELRINP